MSRKSDHNDEVLVALRRIIRAVDMHSRRLASEYGLTGPQAQVLKAVIESNGLTAGALARRVSLSQATITDILKRLEQRGLVLRERCDNDRRRVNVRATHDAVAILSTAPPLLQDTFVERFARLQRWEQLMLLSSLQRIAEMMDAEGLDAAPMLVPGVPSDPPTPLQ
ncbi:MarR family transcriptional regulator [Marinobacterium nitratireducens]|uniref:MarR family transcriptional regulator n=1 Tax=Marinobacterium nitratireducens TaxID=518897 RepID=A0A917ZF34_9GAMM|nr:MarR family transcriptional regulator [Marinobacterium nitratireducens]GGO80809.1 MarR family transcriptional regulator [Marinobacterium nitratireducens]